MTRCDQTQEKSARTECYENVNEFNSHITELDDLKKTEERKQDNKEQKELNEKINKKK